MGINLRNNIYASTDSFGNWSEESVSLGFVNYGNEGKEYYSYDETEELIRLGKIDEEEFFRDCESKLHLKERYCSACTCFRVVCGQIIHETEYANLVHYAKKIGVISDEFRVVKGWFGDKFIKENNGLYDLTYTFTKTSNSMDLDYAEKICIGAIKKLAGDRRRIHSKDEIIVERWFKCEEVYFDKENTVLHIKGIPKQNITGEITSTLKQLDLELWILFNEDKYWQRFFVSAIDAVRDCNQYHWFKRLYKDSSEENEKESNYHWFDKKLGEEWK